MSDNKATRTVTVADLPDIGSAPAPGGRGPTVADLASHIREVTAVRPGDVLVMKLAPDVDAADMRQLATQLRAAAPDLVVLVVGGDIHLTVMRRDEQP